MDVQLEIVIVPGDFIDLVDFGKQKDFCNAGALQLKLKRRGWRIAKRQMIDGLLAEVWRPKQGLKLKEGEA